MSTRRFEVSLEALEAEEADFRRVVAAVRKIQAASLDQLRDFDWLLEVVCSVGLTMLPPVEVTYGKYADLVNASHQGISQYPTEFVRWLLLAGKYAPASYLEIGTFNGNTASLATAYLQRFNPALRAVTVDVFPCFLFHHLVRDLIPLEYRVGTTSYGLQGERFEAVFIDGDHSFDWAWADYQNVGRGARVCGVHDIASMLYYDSMAYGGVTGCWEYLRRTEGSAGVEFHEFCDHPAGDKFGIGVRVAK